MKTEFFKKQLKKHHKYIKVEITEKFRGKPQVIKKAHAYITNLLVQNDYERVRSYDPGKDKKFSIFLINLVAMLIEIFEAHERFFSHYNVIEKAVDKRLEHNSEFKDKAMHDLNEMLTENDYEKLRKHDSEKIASFKPYFYVVIYRLISNLQEESNGKQIPDREEKESNPAPEKIVASSAEKPLQEDPCPSDNEMAAYIGGTLEAEIREKISEHLKNCKACREISPFIKELEAETTQPAPFPEPESKKVIPFPIKRLHRMRGSLTAKRHKKHKVTIAAGITALAASLILILVFL